MTRRFVREFWLPKHYREFPAWQCPSCGTGAPSPSAAGPPKWLPSAASQKAGEDPGSYPPDDTEGKSIGFLACNSCGEQVAFAAETCLDYFGNPRDGDVWEPVHRPLFFAPALPMIEVPEGISEEVRSALARSF